MLHEVGAAMRMRCLVAVVGHTGHHAGSEPTQGHVGTCACRDCVSFAGLMWGLKCVWGAWHGMWVVGISHEVCADMRIQCLVAVVGHVHRAAGPAQGHVGTCDCVIRRRHVGVHMCFRCMAWHVGRGDVV